MSSKKRGAPARRNNRRICKQSEDDMPLSLLDFTSPKRPRGRKKSNPQTKNKKRLAAAATSAAAPPEIVNIDENPEDTEMFNNVCTKVGAFMQSGSFISSDEDETEMIKAKTNKKPLPNSFFISDDSDDECKEVKCSDNISNFNPSEPGTSAGTSTDPSKDNKKALDDIMIIVDSVLDEPDFSTPKKQNSLKNMKSLEDYRKETEEILKNATCFLDELKTGRKPEVEHKEEESSPKVTVGACPICLESLASRQASVTVCGHIFCKECILKTAQTIKKCPTCRKTINSKKIHPIYF